jgi:hypothetical protein
MSSSTKTNSSSNSSATQTPTNPSWVTQPLQGLTSDITALGNVNPQSYVAPQSSLQVQANNQGAATLSTPNPAFSTASGLFGSAASGVSPTQNGAFGSANDVLTANSGTNGNFGTAANDIASNTSVDPNSVASWMSPYQSSVIDSENNLMDSQFGQQTAAQSAAAAAAGAFGGSRFGVAQGVLQGQQGLTKATTDANLLNTGYDNAQTAAFNNAQLGQNAGALSTQLGSAEDSSALAKAGAFQGLGTAEDASSLAKAGLLGQLGTDQTNLGTNETASNVADLQELQSLGTGQQATAQAQATAPISLAQTLASLYGQNQFGLFNGQTATGNSNSSSTTTQSNPLGILSSIFGGLGSAANGGSSLASMFAPSGGSTSGGAFSQFADLMG